MIVDQHKPSSDWTGWTPESRQRWLTLRTDGKSHAEIGRILGCGKGASVAQNRLYKDGTMQPQEKTKPLSEAEIAEIRRLHESGHSRTEIKRAVHRGDKYIIEALGRAPQPVKATDPYKAAAQKIAAATRKPSAERKFAAPRIQARGCCLYLIGDSKPWVQCEKPIEHGSYCRSHALVCYVPIVRKAA